MVRTVVASMVALLVCAGGLRADSVTGKFIKWDAEKKVLTVSVDGQEKDYTLSEQTQVVNAQGKPNKQGVKIFEKGKAGKTAYTLTVTTKGGKEVVTEVKPAGAAKPKKPKTGKPPLR
jgi:hypothetical protein